MLLINDLVKLLDEGSDEFAEFQFGMHRNDRLWEDIQERARILVERRGGGRS
ncbi:hypothetical protein GS466_24975 [Rhodococcus hoagii]|nr:hypothetical protein [Prescottella equi]